MLEVYYAVEFAVTQLQAVGGLEHLDHDLQLINTLVMKLPLAEHRNYADYITSEGNQVQSSSKWTTFWDWLRRRYDSSLQVRIMHLCFDQTDIARKACTQQMTPDQAFETESGLVDDFGAIS